MGTSTHSPVLQPQDTAKSKSTSLPPVFCSPKTEQGATEEDSPQVLVAPGLKPEDLTQAMHMGVICNPRQCSLLIKFPNTSAGCILLDNEPASPSPQLPAGPHGIIMCHILLYLLLPVISSDLICLNSSAWTRAAELTFDNDTHQLSAEQNSRFPI